METCLRNEGRDRCRKPQKLQGESANPHRMYVKEKFIWGGRTKHSRRPTSQIEESRILIQGKNEKKKGGEAAFRSDGEVPEVPKWKLKLNNPKNDHDRTTNRELRSKGEEKKVVEVKTEGMHQPRYCGRGKEERTPRRGL